MFATSIGVIKSDTRSLDYGSYASKYPVFMVKGVPILRIPVCGSLEGVNYSILRPPYFGKLPNPKTIQMIVLGSSRGDRRRGRGRREKIKKP